MTKKLTDREKKIDDLQAEESIIESRSTHQGFRDASRRNRIEEEVNALEEASRRD
ncbi:hypothetical protein SAMN05421770_10247 [Granulicella rosea]|uniref:Uncharacterized protein n=1 Tax=Granulicella rosea TaxID=474952 RepID=A0A239GR90_9BACT|nr:hypothetical protein [Granulicella rosea]SNS71657.1 hypothetical protein SAMN05421770_10247 [Granulicella rosea]